MPHRIVSKPWVLALPRILYRGCWTCGKVAGNQESELCRGGVQTQFSLLPGVREEGERKEEKDKYPCPPIAYRILVAGAGRQPCSFPTVRSKKRRLCDVFPTFGLRLLRIDRRGANRDPVESARRLPQDQLDALLLPTCKPGRASWRILDSSACVRSQRTENIIIQGGWNNNCSSRVSTDPAQTVIDGNASGSVISITSNSTATLEALTITNGQSNKGGGVYVSGASPTLDNVVVSGNAISTMLTPAFHRTVGCTWAPVALP